MFYDFTICIPANTAEENYVETECKLTAGIIHRVELFFPAGCVGLAHIKIFHQEHQIWPTNSNEDFASNKESIVFDEYYKLENLPHILKIRAWNEDDTYDHSVRVRFGVLRTETLQPVSTTTNLLTRLKQALVS